MSDKPSLYQRLLAHDFSRLATLPQRFHREPGLLWQGEADIDWSDEPLLAMLLAGLRLPRPGRAVPLRVTVAADGEGERWQRDFAGRRLQSRQELGDGYLLERFGPWSLQLHSAVIDGALHQHAASSRCCAIPLPSPLALRVQATEWEAAGRFRFQVAIAIGRRPLLHYRGWLEPAGSDR